MLLPRLTSTQRNLIANPASGLVIYNTDASAFEYFDGSSWQPLASSELGSELSGITSILGPDIPVTARSLLEFEDQTTDVSETNRMFYRVEILD